MSSVPDRRYTPEEYLAFERVSETKHEYYAGQIYAMTGASLLHVRIVGNLMRILGNQLLNSGCVSLCNDLRVKTADGVYTYPDVLVVCDEPLLEDTRKDTLLNPQIVIEVLSPSTENYDRGNKFVHYQSIASLEEYILVAQDRPQVVQYTRQPDRKDWNSIWLNGLSESLSLKPLACNIPLSELYLQIVFPDDLPLLHPHDPLASAP